MIKVNKKLPVSVIRDLKDFVTERNISNETLFSVEIGDEHLFKAVDVDVVSEFFFLIQEYNETHGYYIRYKPASQSNNKEHAVWGTEKSIANHFNNWYDCLAAYAALEEEVKDPFLKSLEEQFLEGFNLKDDSKNEPLTIKQLFFLEESLEKIQNEISAYSTHENQSEILEIIEDVTNLRNDLGKRGQEWVAKKFATILAKITKEGPGILKGIFKEAGKQIMTQGVKYLIEQGSSMIG